MFDAFTWQSARGVVHPLCTVAPMTDIGKRNEQRSEFLVVLYELSDGDRSNSFTLDKILPQLQGATTRDEVQPVADWLRDNGLVDIRSLAGDYHLTPAGVNDAERLIAAAKEASRAAGPVIDVDAVDDDTAPFTSDELAAMRQLVVGYRQMKANGELGLSKEAEEDADVLIANVEQQVESPRPKRRVVFAALRELGLFARSVLHAIANDVIKFQLGIGE